jgi:uncharacterized protein DUF4230
MVITRESGGTELEQFHSGEKGLLVAAGDAEAGVNLADLGQDDVRVSGQTVTIRLPDPEILSVSLDEDDAPVYDRHFSLLNIRTDDDLVEEARDVAVNRIEEAAGDENILNQAEQNAENVIRAFVTSLGFEEVGFAEWRRPVETIPRSFRSRLVPSRRGERPLPCYLASPARPPKCGYASHSRYLPRCAPGRARARRRGCGRALARAAR